METRTVGTEVTQISFSLHVCHFQTVKNRKTGKSPWVTKAQVSHKVNNTEMHQSLDHNSAPKLG